MDYYLQYHNVDDEGLLLDDAPFRKTRLWIHTRVPQVRTAAGRVFLIAGLGRPRRYFLWQTFEIKFVRRGTDGDYRASGTGWELAPPAALAQR
ncbi:MAG TPA: hypothetical protein VH120_06790 [Gemmataceae bacterium]|jgi:hypothetical protein|nr:hypothetical protein [Gemmataceae bacterium]